MINYLSKLTIYYNFPYLYNKLAIKYKNNYDWNKLNNKILRTTIMIMRNKLHRNPQILINEALDYLEKGILDKNTYKRNRILLIPDIHDIILKD